MRIEDLEDLVYDRTLDDAQRLAAMQQRGYPNLSTEELAEWNSLCSKGALNVSDINRVISYIPVLQKALIDLGFTSAGVSVYPPFDIYSDLYLETMTSIQQDIETLCSHFYALNGYAALVRGPSWNYEQSNALEQNLYILAKRIRAAKDVRVRSAQTMVNCGSLTAYLPMRTMYTLCDKNGVVLCDSNGAVLKAGNL